jgi:hypothetical protein
VGLLYLLDLNLHPLLGLGTSGYLLRYMTRRMESTAPSLSTRTWVVGPVVLGLNSTLLGLVSSSMSLFLTLTLAQVAYDLVGGWRLTVKRSGASVSPELSRSDAPSLQRALLLKLQGRPIYDHAYQGPEEPR